MLLYTEMRNTPKFLFHRFVNHLFYWSVMSPTTGDMARIPKGRLRDEIDQQFESYDKF